MAYGLRRKPSIGAIGALAVLAAVVIGYAAIPGAGGVISACYNPSLNPSGTLRVIDAEGGAKCGKNERLLTFNQTGPQGSKGDKGDPGTNGTNGIDGTNGTNGLNGAPGPQGPAGVAGISTATFAGAGPTQLDLVPVKVASKILGAGSWVVFATANINGIVALGGSGIGGVAFDSDTYCELRSLGGYIGGATDRRETPAGQFTKISLSLFGGAQIPEGGGEVSLWCSYQDFNAVLQNALMVMLQVGGFS